MLNTMVAEELSGFYEKLNGETDIYTAVKALVKETLTAHQRIIFNGDNYTDEWVEEAARRGLCNYKSLPDAMEHYIDKKNIDLFVKHGIVSEQEIHARYEIELEHYSKQLNIEALSMLEMAKRDITPAVITFINELAQTVSFKKQASPFMSCYAEEGLLKSLSEELEAFVKKTDELEAAVKNAADYSGDNLEHAKYFRNTVFALMEELRAVGDEMETEMPSKYWPYPSYGEILFGV